MNLTRHKMEPLGFKGNGIYANAQHHNVYYREVPSECRVDVVTSYGLQTVSQFHLTKQQFRRFKANKLGLVPPGCCSASGRPCLENPKMLFEGTIKSIKHLKEILDEATDITGGRAVRSHKRNS